jgi:hypothetical protein
MKTTYYLIIVLFVLSSCNNHEKETVATERQKQWEADLNPVYTIYSGNCICYKKTIENNNTQIRYTPVGNGFAKLVVSSNKSHLVSIIIINSFSLKMNLILTLIKMENKDLQVMAQQMHTDT